jgi:hypothetical protein
MVKKICEMSDSDIIAEMDKIKKKCIENYKFVGDNKRWKALLNERARRQGFNFR